MLATNCSASEEHIGLTLNARTLNRSTIIQVARASEEERLREEFSRILALHEKIKNHVQLTDEDNELIRRIGRFVMKPPFAPQ